MYRPDDLVMVKLQIPHGEPTPESCPPAPTPIYGMKKNKMGNFEVSRKVSRAEILINPTKAET